MRSARAPYRLLMLVATITVAIGAVLCAAGLSNHSAPAHFSLLADALLHGRLDLGGPVTDAAPFRGHWYEPFGPAPGLLMVPFVALDGPGAPVLLITLPLTAWNAWWLTRLWPAIGIAERERGLWLTLLTLAGTEYFSALVVNSSYFAAHIVAVAMLLPALLLALRRRLPLLAGLLVGLAAAARAPALFAALPIALLYLARAERARRLQAILVGVGLLPVLLGLAAYNQARFGNPLETGYDLQLQPAQLLVARHAGMQSLAHLPKDLYFFSIAAPEPVGGLGTPVLHLPWFEPSPWGMGIIFVAPWLLAGLWARGRLALLMAPALLILVPGLLQLSGGWAQFGYRYRLDALPFLAAVAALGLSRAPRRWMIGLACYGVLVNAWGAAWLVSFLGGG